MRFILLAATLALCAASASAQTIYTTVGLDGHKTFSDRADTTADTVPEVSEEPGVAKAAVRRSLVPSRLSATVDLYEAERRLTQAQRKRSEGIAPLPGESEKVPGGIVVNAQYLSRQERLDREVGQAERRLHQVQRPQLAQR